MGMGLLFVVVQVIAIAIAPVYSEAEAEALGGKETIENPGFAFLYLGIILLVTFVILMIAKRKKEKFIKILILAAIFMTMVYLFIPLTIAVMYPPSEDGWGHNDIGFAVTALNAGDVDDDGIIEIVAGCSDNKIRVFESENHTLEWEGPDIGSNIIQIQIANLDNDTNSEIVVLSDGIIIYDGHTKSEDWSNTTENFTTITTVNLNASLPDALVAGTTDARIIITLLDSFYTQIDLSANLNNISFLNVFFDEATENVTIIAADTSTIVVGIPRVFDPDIELEITELEVINALTVYQNPNDEDYIIAADDKRAYLFNLSSDEHIRRSPEFKDIRSLYLDYYSIPGFDDDIPDVIVLGDRTVYISPDLLKTDENYYYLKFKYDLYSFISTDLDDDGTKEIILGVEDGYRYTSITFGEGPNLVIPFVVSLIIASSLTLLVHKYPEWYVVDSVGLVMAIGATIILGVTFAILPAIVLLIVLGIYDAVSVYKTKHMISLADSVIDLNLPVLLVIPKKWGYSFREKKPRLKEQLESGTEREAMFMGLGDIVIPSLLIVSALSFLPSGQSGIGIANNLLVGIGTMIGILVGFSILMRFVMKGNPQAGLPLLNSGAILGYLITYILVYGDFGFGFNLNF
jgi:presenilin-like A22 family membrane protease